MREKGLSGGERVKYVKIRKHRAELEESSRRALPLVTSHVDSQGWGGS